MAQAGQTLQAEEDARKFERFISMEGRWVNGYGITTAGDSHDVTIDPGEAFVGDDKLKLIGDVNGAHGDADTSVVKTLTNFGSTGDTFHIYLKIDGNLEINTSGTAPDDSIKLWTVTTDSNGVTDTTDERTALVNIAADVEGKNVTARKQLAGETGKLDKGTDPEWIWTDGSATLKVRLDSASGKLQVLDGSDTVQTDDLSNISNPVDETDTDTTKDKTVSNALAKGWEDHKDASAPHSGHEDTANKGTASGYAGLDSNTEVAQSAKSVALADRTEGAGTVWVDDTADDFKFRHSGGVETTERVSRKGAASGYAGLDDSQLVNQRTKLVRTTTPGSSTAGDIWVTSSDLNFRDGSASQHTVAKDADLQAHIGDTGTDAHGTVTAGGEAGFMSGSDKTKLDGVEAGAEVNQNAFDRVRADDGNTVQAGSETSLADIDGGTDIETSVVSGNFVINHADTSSQSDVSAASGAAITSATLDGRGHVTGLGTTDFDGHFVNEGQASSISSGMLAADVALVSYNELFSAAHNPSASGAWEDWDISSELSTDAVVAEIAIEQTQNTSNEIGVRKNGSTSERRFLASDDTTIVMKVDVSSSQTVEIFTSDSVNQSNFHVIGEIVSS